jgi:hypothetical protein
MSAKHRKTAPLSLRIPQRLNKELMRRAERGLLSKSAYVRLVLQAHCGHVAEPVAAPVA